jgi:hypothetical protein
MQGQIGATRKILAPQSVGVLTMQPGIVAQLFQDERRNVFSRYGSAMEVGELRERPHRFAVTLVVQDGRTNENPVEAAVSDDRFLPILVGVHLAQEKRMYQLVKEKASVPGTVTRANPGDADQRETCSAFIALTSARVAVERSLTSLNGPAGVPSAMIAALALFLCGEGAAQITGANLSIDGGWTAA